MELLIKAGAVCVLSCIAGLLLKKTNPELGLLLSVCTVTVILSGCLCLAGCIGDLAKEVQRLMGSGGEYTLPVLKCLGTAICTKISSDLCREAAQPAAASAIELAGAFCALGIAAPLLVTVLRMIGDIV